jgi:hypothetical protein
MPRLASAFALLAAMPAGTYAHDVITTAITFNREISRILIERCASCHHPQGTAFSMLTYGEARPWAVAIKGFGAFRNDQGLTAEELERLLSWIDGGVPEGEDKDLPPPPKYSPPPVYKIPPGAVTISGDYKLTRPFKLDGLMPKTVPPRASMRIVAELPNGAVEPLLWLDGYNSDFPHPFLLRTPLNLPAGAVIRGVAPGSSIALLPEAPASRKTAAASRP